MGQRGSVTGSGTGDPVDFYVFKDKDGRDVVTNDKADIPADARDVAVVHAGDAPARAADFVAGARGSVEGGAEPGFVFNGPSFVLGAAAMLVVGGGAVFGRAGGRSLVRFAVVAVVVVVAAGGYFGWVMRTAGLSNGAFADPRDAVTEAKAVRDQANTRRAVEEEIAAQK